METHIDIKVICPADDDYKLEAVGEHGSIIVPLKPKILAEDQAMLLAEIYCEKHKLPTPKNLRTISSQHWQVVISAPVSTQEKDGNQSGTEESKKSPVGITERVIASFLLAAGACLVLGIFIGLDTSSGIPVTIPNVIDAIQLTFIKAYAVFFIIGLWSYKRKKPRPKGLEIESKIEKYSEKIPTKKSHDVIEDQATVITKGLEVEQLPKKNIGGVVILVLIGLGVFLIAGYFNGVRIEKRQKAIAEKYDNPYDSILDPKSVRSTDYPVAKKAAPSHSNNAGETAGFTHVFLNAEKSLSLIESVEVYSSLLQKGHNYDTANKSAKIDVSLEGSHAEFLFTNIPPVYWFGVQLKFPKYNFVHEMPIDLESLQLTGGSGDLVGGTNCEITIKDIDNNGEIEFIVAFRSFFDQELTILVYNFILPAGSQNIETEGEWLLLGHFKGEGSILFRGNDLVLVKGSDESLIYNIAGKKMIKRDGEVSSFGGEKLNSKTQWLADFLGEDDFKKLKPEMVKMFEGSKALKGLSNRFEAEIKSQLTEDQYRALINRALKHNLGEIEQMFMGAETDEDRLLADAFFVCHMYDRARTFVMTLNSASKDQHESISTQFTEKIKGYNQYREKFDAIYKRESVANNSLAATLQAKSKTPMKGNASFQGWQYVSVPGICSFQIPPTMEMQNEILKVVTDSLLDSHLRTHYPKEKLTLSTSLEKVTAQQKGLNANSPESLKHFCRVTIETQVGQIGEFDLLSDPMISSHGELKEIEAMFKSELEKVSRLSENTGFKMTLLSTGPLEIENVNGVGALVFSYVRQNETKPPAKVKRYLFPNNDCLHTVTLTYRITEEELWKADFDKIINTFKFNDRKSIARSGEGLTDGSVKKTTIPSKKSEIKIPASTPESASQVKSYWDHNGSTMGLLVEGNGRTFIYVKVRDGLNDLVEPGMKLFDGVSSGILYSGKARSFAKDLPPVEFDVEGVIVDDGRRIVVNGKSPIRNSKGEIVKTVDEEMIFTFLKVAD